MPVKDYILTEMTENLLDPVMELCGESVGENLYEKSEFADTLTNPDSQILVLAAEDGTVGGYIYFRLADLSEAERISGQDLQKLNASVFRDSSRIGILQSIAVAKSLRHQGLALRLTQAYLDWIEKEWNADLAFGVFWKPKGVVPMDHILRESGFSYLVDSPRLWYNNNRLICPVCGGRCSCDAAVYYKITGKKKTGRNQGL